MFNAALRSGEIVRGDACEACGGTGGKRALDGHHDDYTKPLDVRWLCRSCHGEVHANSSVEEGSLGWHLRRSRIDAGYETQQSAAEALVKAGVRVAARTIGMYETGGAKPPYKTLHAIASLYGASYSQLSLMAADGGR
jgi:hypothetical protein